MLQLLADCLLNNLTVMACTLKQAAGSEDEHPQLQSLCCSITTSCLHGLWPQIQDMSTNQAAQLSTSLLQGCSQPDSWVTDQPGDWKLERLPTHGASELLPSWSKATHTPRCFAHGRLISTVEVLLTACLTASIISSASCAGLELPVGLPPTGNASCTLASIST